MSCVDVREEIAVRLLTGRELAEPVRRHLAGCPECRAEHETLATVPPLLAQVPEGVPGGADPALDRLLAAAAGDRRRRRVRLMLVAALVAVAVPLAAWGLSAAGSSPHHPAAGTVVASASNPGTGVSGRVRIEPTDAGSSVTVTLDGVTPGTLCRLVVRTGAGSQTVATWRATYAGRASVQNQIPTPADQVQQLDVLDAAGHLLLAVPTST